MDAFLCCAFVISLQDGCKFLLVPLSLWTAECSPARPNQRILNGSTLGLLHGNYSLFEKGSLQTFTGKKQKPVLKRFFSVKLLLPKGSRTWVNTFGNKQRTVFVTLFVCCVFVVVCFVYLLRVCGLSAKVKPQRSRKIDPKLPWCLNVILGPILQVHGALCGHGAGG